MTKDQLKLIGAKNLVSVTINLDFYIRDYESKDPEDLVKEWFKDSPLTIRTMGHVYRDNCIVGGSEKITNIEIK